MEGFVMYQVCTEIEGGAWDFLGSSCDTKQSALRELRDYKTTHPAVRR